MRDLFQKYLKDDTLQNCLSFAIYVVQYNATSMVVTSAFENINSFREKAKSLFNIK